MKTVLGIDAAGTAHNPSGVALVGEMEDALDAVVCAWVGVCALEGRAKAYGDADSAIWVPSLERPLR